mmetsp:Transcript_10115/g.29947  ORF Transcript_10115/g.29947 Transcript_10115/m.29947 type:complete len:244 (+) Transcript_10115:2019-2750(+)
MECRCRSSRQACAASGDTRRTRAKPEGRPSRLCRRCTAEPAQPSANIASYFGPRNLQTSCAVARYGRPRSWSEEGPSTSSSNGAGLAARWAAAALPVDRAASPRSRSAILAIASVRASEPGARDTDSWPGGPAMTKRLVFCCSQLRRPPLSFRRCLAPAGTRAPRSERSRLRSDCCERSWMSWASRRPSLQSSSASRACSPSWASSGASVPSRKLNSSPMRTWCGPRRGGGALGGAGCLEPMD